MADRSRHGGMAKGADWGFWLFPSRQGRGAISPPRGGGNNGAFTAFPVDSGL